MKQPVKTYFDNMFTRLDFLVLQIQNLKDNKLNDNKNTAGRRR